MNKPPSRFIDKIKSLDFFPKTEEDVTVRSSIGAVATFVGIGLFLFLSFSEYKIWQEPIQKSIMTVKHSTSGERMRVNFRITFSELPCSVISFDLSDKLGNDQTNVYVDKTPFKGDFDAILDEARTTKFTRGLSEESRVWALVRNNMHAIDIGGCGSCHEANAKSKEKLCCNSCYELRVAYAKTGLDPKLAYNYKICEGPPEGCITSGSLIIPLNPGNFHIAVGESHKESDQVHHHHWNKEDRKIPFNTTHYIHHLSFGREYPGMKNPLDGYYFVEKNGFGQQQYFIQIVPTTYAKSRETLTTNQYSFTSHHNVIDPEENEPTLPGVFFRYDINPVKISIFSEYMPLHSLITRIFAVIGGTWTILTVVYQVTSLASKLFGYNPKKTL